MLINVEPENLLKKGVYKIINKTTGKYYIGSTVMTFLKRLQHHISRLRANKHKNPYLQNSYNKYGEDDFQFDIIEVTDKIQCLVREQYWLDTLHCYDKSLSFNINLKATSVTCPENIEKRRQTMLKKYANGELDHVKEILRNKIPWNKGKKYNNTNHLKVPKTKTIEFKTARKNVKEKHRAKLPMVYVYDMNMKLLGIWNNSKVLEEWSKTENNNYPIKSRFKGDFRMDIPANVLQSVSINKSCKLKIPYKNLIFSNVPLHEEIRVEKWDELLENPIVK